MVKWGGIFVGTVRCVFFAVIAAALIPAFVLPGPRPAGVGDFFHDVRDGRASAILIPPTSGWLDPDDDTTVTWRTGFATWHRAPYSVYGGPYYDNPRATLPDGTVTIAGTTINAPSGVVRDQLIAVAREASAAGGHGGISVSEQMQLSDIAHLAPSPVTGVVVTALFAWALLLTFIFTVSPGSYATKWAWVWLFTIGVIGPLLFLWKEPASPYLLRRRGSRPTRAPISGGNGFLRALAWVFALIVLGTVLS